MVLDTVFVGDNFDVALVFGLVNVVDRVDDDGTGADLTRDPIEETAGFVADTLDAVVAGFGATDLNKHTKLFNWLRFGFEMEMK